MADRARRVRFRVRYFCGHGEWQTTLDGPGAAWVMQRAQDVARQAQCPGCRRRQAARTAAHWTERY